MRRNLIVAAFASLATVSVFAAQHPGRRAQSEAVFAPKQDFAGARALARQELASRQDETRYRGLVVLPHPEAAGADRKLQRQVCVLMERLDFVPDQRLTHFRWLNHVPAVLTGWEGTIEDTTPAPGGVRLMMKVYPKHTGGGIAAVDDHYVEYYRYAQGRLQYLGAEGTPAKVITFN